jgi:amidohydrolase
MDKNVDFGSLRIREEVAELHEEMVQLRRDMHRVPELMFDLPCTREIILKYLKQLGLKVYEQVGKAGIVAVLENPGSCVLLRADMDALNITERNEKPYQSIHSGNMHACGHDGHVAMLLIAAKVLSKMHLCGSVKFLFQPAEEGGHGAREMILDSEYPVLENPSVDSVYGIHLTNAVKMGNFIAAPQWASCSSDYFFIEIIGKGGHASAPFLTIDPISAGCQLVVTLQTIVSRNVDPKHQAVLSVTMLHSGEVFNAIPDECKIRGTIRTFEPEVRALIEKRIQEICVGIESGFSCKVHLRFEHFYDPVENNEVCADQCAATFSKVSPQGVRGTVAPLIGEDFFYFTNAKPGCFMMLGCGTDELDAPLHSPSFDFDERAMLIGASYWVQLIVDLLSP